MVLRGRQSEEAVVEMERANGSLCPLGGPFCAGPRASSCCSDMQLSVGLSEACQTASSFFHLTVHSKKQVVISGPRMFSTGTKSVISYHLT